MVLRTHYMKKIIVSISMLAMTFGLMAGEAHNHGAAAKGKSECCDKAQTAAKAGSCDKAKTAGAASTCDKAKTAGTAAKCDKAQTAAKAACCDKAQTAAKAGSCDKAKTAGKASCDSAKSADAKRATGLGTKGGQLLVSSL